MHKEKMKTIDGNTAAAHVAYAFSEVCAIYPITPSTTMAELVDEWSSAGRKNIFDETVEVVEMQSEAGAAGALHGALTSGAFCSTFTASQGLLLMIPNMYKIAGELLPCVFHVTARALATHSLSIFGDQQDVMATRATGFAFLASSSVQEAMDLALVAHLSTLRASVPFMHFFDGFRTSHEIQKIETIDYEDMKKLIDFEKVKEHRKRALNPAAPFFRGSAQNPDIYFQAAETSNSYYEKIPAIVEEEMEKVFKLTNRKYNLFDYVGAKNPKKLIIMMGSGAETAEETIAYLNKKNETFGLLKVRLFRPFSLKHFLNAIPKSVEKIAVLERTKENGALGEPLYLDVCSAFKDSKSKPMIIGGRYGLGSKEFTPSMVKAVFDNLDKKEPKTRFTVGIVDDVTFTSLPIEEKISLESNSINCKFFGLGGDGTVGANKDAIKIIGDNTDNFVQGYFSYDSKKSYGFTVSHLRISKKPIKDTYLIESPDYVACHEASYVTKFDLLKGIKEGGCFVLNCPWNFTEIEKHLPNFLKREIAEKKIKFYAINAEEVAKKVGLGRKINMVMQTVFFKLSNIIPIEDAIGYLIRAIEHTYGNKGQEVVAKNKAAVEGALETLFEVKYPASWALLKDEAVKEDPNRPCFVKNVADVMNRLEGDSLPVSAFAPGGVFPTDTTQWEKRGFALQLPKWISANCIQCGQCSFVCPHGVIRPFIISKEDAAKAPPGYQGVKALGKGMEDNLFSIEVSSLDCTGCGNCQDVCPAKTKALEMKPKEELESQEAELFTYVSSCEQRSSDMGKYTLKGSQFQKPLFEFSGACGGCGETPYLKLLSQLYGERMIVANATGCTSIYGGSVSSCPWSTAKSKRGPAWANSLFEDNAEFGLGIYLAQTARRHKLKTFFQKALQQGIENLELKKLFESFIDNFENGDITLELGEKITALLKNEKRSDVLEEIFARRDLIAKPSVWMIGGDGWAYDIGYGGLDHVLALGKDVNVLVVDTEVYSNTGGQSSKSTPIGSTAKFAASGKKTFKKDLGMMAMTYGNVYVASVSMGSDKNQVLRAFKEAESYPGPSLILAYASCINHGIKKGMFKSLEEAKKAVEVGYWFNYRYDPRLRNEGKNPFSLDSKEPTFDIEPFLDGQVRYDLLKRTNFHEAQRLHLEMKKFLEEKYRYYKELASKK